MTIKIKVGKASSESVAYARTNGRIDAHDERLTAIETKNTQQDSSMNAVVADTEKIKSLIDVDGSGDTLVFNIGGKKIRLIFNNDGSVTWKDFNEPINMFDLSAANIKLGGPEMEEI